MDPVWSQSPHGWAKLEDLSAATGRVMNAVLSPPDYLTQVVCSGCEAIIATGKWGKSPHLSLSPNEPEIDVPNVVRRAVEARATPAFTEQLGICSLRNTHDDTRGIFHVPCDTAVWSTEGAKVS